MLIVLGAKGDFSVFLKKIRKLMIVLGAKGEFCVF